MTNIEKILENAKEVMVNLESGFVSIPLSKKWVKKIRIDTGCSTSQLTYSRKEDPYEFLLNDYQAPYNFSLGETLILESLMENWTWITRVTDTVYLFNDEPETMENGKLRLDEDLKYSMAFNSVFPYFPIDQIPNGKPIRIAEILENCEVYDDYE